MPMRARGKILLAAAVIGGMLALCRAQNQPDMPAIVSVSVNGNPLKIPQAYFPDWGRMRPGETKTDALVVVAEWPGMKPFTEQDDDRPVYISLHDELSILIDPAGENTVSEQSAFLRRVSADWLEKRVPAGERFGLLRFVYKDIEQFKHTGRDEYGAQELFLAPSQARPETLITCSPDFEPDPDTEAAAQLRKAGEFVKNPRCEQDFFVPGMQNVRVNVSYFRIHLKDWKRIQESVVRLLQSFKNFQARN